MDNLSKHFCFVAETFSVYEDFHRMVLFYYAFDILVRYVVNGCFMVITQNYSPANSIPNPPLLHPKPISNYIMSHANEVK